MSQGVVAIFGSSRVERSSAEWRDAQTAGARCAEAGLGVITGGYGGVMEAASEGAAEAGGRVLGATAPGLFIGRPGANPFVDEEIPAESLGQRLDALTGRADAVLVLPGSIGTAAELLVAWHINHIARTNGATRLPTVAVGPVWNDLRSLLTDRTGAQPGDIHIEATVEAAVTWIFSQLEIR